MTRHTIFVLEGPDGVGKTTLGKALVERLNGRYLHLTYRYPDNMFGYHRAAIEWCLKKAKNQHVILDRWWPSEVAYAKAYRGGTKCPYISVLLDTMALTHDIVYIWCMPHDRERVGTNFAQLKDKREEMYSEGMLRVYDAFDVLMRKMDRGSRLHFRYDVFSVVDGAISMTRWIEWMINSVALRLNVCSKQEYPSCLVGNRWNPDEGFIIDEPLSKRPVLSEATPKSLKFAEYAHLSRPNYVAVNIHHVASPEFREYRHMRPEIEWRFF